MRYLSYVLVLITVISGSTGWSEVIYSKTQNLILPADVSEPIMTAETSRRLQPKSAAPGDSGSSVLSQIADNSLSFLWDRSGIKNTSVGRVAEKVEKNLKTEMNFTDSSPRKTQHKITFKVLAMQALAKLEYTGWLTAALNYDVRAASAEAEISEKLSNQQVFVMTLASTREETKSQVALRWNW
jgi:hypothetical protein